MASTSSAFPAKRSLPIARGTALYRRASFALFLAGFSTFSLLYCVQPLLPAFSRSFGVDPATSALSLSLTTGALALAIFAAGAISEGMDRRRLMFASMAFGALLNIAAAIAPGWHLLLAARLMEGLVLGGVPAVAMAYLAEEMDPRDLGRAMGLYVAGTAFGGMMGRVGMGLLADLTSWRAAMAALGALGLAAAAGFALLLPPPQGFVARRRAGGLRHHLAAWSALLKQSGTRRLFAVGFILMSMFVSIFNYAGFRLSDAPYDFSQSQISLIFLAYIFGMFASSIGGGLADRFGRRVPLASGLVVMAVGVLVTLSAKLPLIVTGISLVTIGFFVAHSVASGWVGRLAGSAKGHAASLYLLFYYMGSSITGSVAGWFWQHGGWPTVAGFTGILALAGLVLALSVREAIVHD